MNELILEKNISLELKKAKLEWENHKIEKPIIIKEINITYGKLLICLENNFLKKQKNNLHNGDIYTQKDIIFMKNLINSELPKIKKSIEIDKQNKIKRKEKIKFAKRLRCHISGALKNKLKLTSTVNLLGCSIQQFREHLEKQFQPGMSWENHSLHGWHIDHIKPISSFDLSTLEEQKKCFHYTNQQPLWAIDNLRKHNKIIK